MGWIRGELLGIWQGKKTYCSAEELGGKSPKERDGGWGTLNE